MADSEKNRTAPAAGRGPSPGGPTGTTSSGPSGRSETERSSSVSSQARQTADKARHTAEDLAVRAKEQGRSNFEKQKHNAAQQMDSVAHAFRSAANQLQGEDQSQAGRYVDLAAEKLESFAGQLRQKDMDTLFRDVEDMGRRSPGALFAGSLVAGFLLARFLKSSAQRRHGTGDWGDDSQRSLFDNERQSGGASFDEYRGTSAGMESSASDLALAGAGVPDTGGMGPSTTVRTPDSGDSISSLNESQPGGTNHGKR